MRCPLRTPHAAEAIEEAHRWAYFTRKPAVLLADVVAQDIVFTVIVGYHDEYVRDRVVVYSVD